MPRALRVVDPVPPEDTPERRMTILDAARTGSRRDVLEAMRDKIASELDGDVPARDLASLTRRLMEIAKDIEAIDVADKGDDVGDAASTADEPWDAD